MQMGTMYVSQSQKNPVWEIVKSSGFEQYELPAWEEGEGTQNQYLGQRAIFYGNPVGGFTGTAQLLSHEKHMHSTHLYIIAPYWIAPR